MSGVVTPWNGIVLNEWCGDSLEWDCFSLLFFFKSNKLRQVVTMALETLTVRNLKLGCF